MSARVSLVGARQVQHNLRAHMSHVHHNLRAHEQHLHHNLRAQA